VHDTPEQRERDRIAREDLEFESDFTVITLRHDENWLSKLSFLDDILN
jgi:hypothetical protein